MIKTRFAPSPTGYIHIGSVRAALYPYLLAKQQNGCFVLRIEDTDRARYVEDATQLIEDTLRWLGLDWDEGPEIGGKNGPYFQTARKSIYHQWAQRLIASGRAYADPTPPSDIAKYREAAQRQKQPFLYRQHRPTNPPQWQPSIPLRFKAQPKTYTYHDAIYGDLQLGPETQDDIILIKQDGLPTYNFAHIVDDATMGITHIMRGQEYLSSMGNYLALYEALGIERPVFAHMPHILGPNGHKKLGKRDGAKSVIEYQAAGILPEALLNYLALLGWREGQAIEQEIYTKAELIKVFSLEHIQKSSARYDETKLLWMNGQWLRKIADEQGVAALYQRSLDFWPAAAADYPATYQKQVLAIIYDRLKTLADLRSMTTYFFSEPQIDLDLLFQHKTLRRLNHAELAKLLQQSLQSLEQISPEEWQASILQDKLNQLLAQTSKKPAELFSLIRLAVSFAPFSPALNLTLETIGRERSLSRLQATQNAIMSQ